MVRASDVDNTSMATICPEDKGCPNDFVRAVLESTTEVRTRPLACPNAVVANCPLSFELLYLGRDNL
jgi:hypothetical protein